MSALIWCPFPDEAGAFAVIDTLLEENLIACANILGDLQSRYVWKGEHGASHEVGVLFKTHSDHLGDAVTRIESLHPYETPAILGWHCEVANPATLEWLSQLGQKRGQ